MIVRKVVGPFTEWAEFVAVCPVLESYLVHGWTYCGDPYGQFGPEFRRGTWLGFLGVFECWPMEGWKIVYVGSPMRCGKYAVEIVVVQGPQVGDGRFYYQSGALYGRRIDEYHFATGDSSF